MAGSHITSADPGTIIHGMHIDMRRLAKVPVIEVPVSGRGGPQAEHGFYIDLPMFDAKRAISLYACKEQSEWKDWMERSFLEKDVYLDPFRGCSRSHVC